VDHQGCKNLDMATQGTVRSESTEAYVPMTEDVVHIQGYLHKRTKDMRWQKVRQRMGRRPRRSAMRLRRRWLRMSCRTRASDALLLPQRWFETNGCFLTYYKSRKMTKLLAALNLPQVGRPCSGSESESQAS